MMSSFGRSGVIREHMPGDFYFKSNDGAFLALPTANRSSGQSTFALDA